MQGIWSRTVLRDRSYQIQLRSTATKTITSIAAKRPACRSTRPINSIFAASYTGVSADASTSEAEAAIAKGQRDESDDRTDETQQKLAQLMEQSWASDLAALVRYSCSYPLSISRPATEVLVEWGRSDPVEIKRRWNEYPNTRYEARRLQRRLGLIRRVSWVDRQAGLAECWRLIELHDTSPCKEREPKTAQQLETQARVITIMARQLMGYALRYESVTPERKLASRSLDSPWNMLRMLQSDGYPRYQHPDLDPEATRRARSAVNEANKKILAQWVPYRIDIALAKICHNLMVSPVPPGINNLNLLILGFSELGEHRLAAILVRGFLRWSLYSPSEATGLCILHHYRLKGDVIGFQELIQRLMADVKDGFLVRRRKIDQLDPDDPWFRNWITTASPQRVGDWLVQRPRLDKIHWEAILQGFVRFGMLEQAAWVFASCLENGVILSAEYLQQLFGSCEELHCLPAAKIVIDALLRHPDAAAFIIFESWGDDASKRLGLVHKLRFLFNMVLGSPEFLSKSNHTLLSDEGTVLPAPAAQLLQQEGLEDDLVRGGVAHLAVLLWIKGLSIGIQRQAEAVVKIQQELDTHNGIEDVTRVVSRAKRSIEHSWRRLGRREMKSTRFRQLGRYLALQRHIEYLNEDLQAAEKRFTQVCRSWTNDLKTWLPWWHEGYNPKRENCISWGSWYRYQRQLMTPGSEANRTWDCFYKSQLVDAELRQLVQEYFAVIQADDQLALHRSSQFTLPLLLQAAALCVRDRRRTMGLVAGIENERALVAPDTAALQIQVDKLSAVTRSLLSDFLVLRGVYLDVERSVQDSKYMCTWREVEREIQQTRQLLEPNPKRPQQPEVQSDGGLDWWTKLLTPLIRQH